MSSGFTCIVDECEADLSDSRKYYQRHKVCETHSKSPQVSINGQNLRFCQQCSRFHSLEEFDEGKRSCRKRLDGHNKRRRKPRQHLFPPTHGSDMLRFGGEHVHPTTNPVWSGVGEGPAWVDHSNYAPSLLSSSFAPPQASVSTMSHVVPPTSDFGSMSQLDQGPSYGGSENDCDADWGGVTDMDPQTPPFYWQS